MNRRNINRLIIGVMLLALGVIWFGNALDFWDVNVLFPGWWAALLMLCFLFSIIGDGANIGNVCGLLIFGAIVLKHNKLIPARVNIWLVALALVVIVLAGKIIVEAFRGPKSSRAPSVSASVSSQESNSSAAGDRANYLFTGETLRFDGQTVGDVSYGVSFGSLTLDFSRAVFADDSIVSVNVNFGEAKIFLPAGVRAESINGAAFASVRNMSSGEKSIKMKLDCAFGAISVFNR